MYLEKIELFNFRNYEKEEEIFSPSVNWIMGKNGQGKTNLLEAIHIFIKATSFRTNRMEEWIGKQDEFAYLKGFFIRDHKEYVIEYEFFKSGKKKIRINGEIVKSPWEILEVFHCVSFIPDDLRLIKEGPQERRNFLDRLIESVFPEYGELLRAYYKILSQRNHLLKWDQNKPHFKEEIRVFTLQLIDKGSKILWYRQKYTQILDELSCSIYGYLSFEQERLTTEYISFIEVGHLNLKEIRRAWIEKLKEEFPRELEKNITTTGPHRDDLQFHLEKNNARIYGSQGQQRTIVFSLKLSEMKMIEKKFHQKPILLLDDIFSELDYCRQKYFLDSIGEGQAFITSAGEGKSLIDTKSIIYIVNQGKIKKKKFSYREEVQ